MFFRLFTVLQMIATLVACEVNNVTKQMGKSQRGLQSAIDWPLLMAADGDGDHDQLGSSVATSGDGSIVATGAPFYNGCMEESWPYEDGTCSGLVRIFRYEEDPLTNSGIYKQAMDIVGDSGDFCGHSVSISKDGLTLAIGCLTGNIIKGSPQVNQGGRTKIYSIATGVANLLGVIDGEIFANGYTGELSGYRISLSEDGLSIAIAAPYGCKAAPYGYKGATRVYSYRGGVWDLVGETICGQTTKDPPSSVALSADGLTVAIGAAMGSDIDEGIYHRGHTRVYRFVPEYDDWAQLGEDIVGDEYNDQSGFSVDISDDGRTVAIGAIYALSLRGRARVYRYTTDPGSEVLYWKQIGQDVDGEGSSGTFGYSVSLSWDGNMFAAGANEYSASDWRIGQARVYAFGGDDEWRQVGSSMVGEEADAIFGCSVSLSNDGSAFVVGAPGHGDGVGGALDAGRVYAYYMGKPEKPGIKIKSLDIVSVDLIEVPEIIVSKIIVSFVVENTSSGSETWVTLRDIHVGFETKPSVDPLLVSCVASSPDYTFMPGEEKMNTFVCATDPFTASEVIANLQIVGLENQLYEYNPKVWEAKSKKFPLERRFLRKAD